MRSALATSLVVLCLASICFCACTYYDSKRGLAFDLSPLTRVGANPDYSISAGAALDYDFNICAASRGQCTPNSGVCQTANFQGQVHHLSCGSSLNGGTLRSYPGSAVGVSLVYAGGDAQFCSGQARASTINVLCDKTARVPRVVSVVENPPCQYNFTMFSMYGCGQDPSPPSPTPPPPPPPSPSNNCSFYDPTRQHLFDLSSLIRGPGQSDYTFTNFDGAKYSMNVCGASKAACTPTGSQGMCQIVDSSQYGCGTASSLAFSPLPLTTGYGVQFSYINGAFCSAGRNRATIVQAVCDPSYSVAQITAVSEQRPCVYYVTLKTAAACDGATPIPPPPNPTGNCTFTNTLTKTRYDLTPMMRVGSNADFSFHIAGEEYKLNICAASRGSCTPKGTQAMCQTSPSASYGCGTAASQVITALPNHVSDDGVHIQYTGGALCSNGMPRVTEIDVLCDASQNPGYIFDVTENPACVYHVTMYSKYACGVKF